ncbi:DUF3905 domain-containing protein [Pseudalkalibacillus caeni]|uniref:DUF3905 domain-containing protein n=1 Tax=Exobacillus caeni TaxID=2574798 RepID=A0A5R9FBB9_9BACL|nr:DUF3905 domain-containing protein [Pseudalkalibacillus caeni]TLS38968.1 DUF3905 domain-containing protein [Pseudalkalibacillus caeni]
MKGKKEKTGMKSPEMDGTLPHQINAPSFTDTDEKLKKPFVNDFDVVIGDSLYNSNNSPLNNWSDEVDPAVMAGDQWVHPTNDIGWNTEENRELIEKKVRPKGTPFMHPSKDVSYLRD